MIGMGSTSWRRSQSSVMLSGGQRLNSSESTMLDLISIFSSVGVTGLSDKGKGKGEVVVTNGSQSDLSGESSTTDPLDDSEESPLSLVCDCFELLMRSLERDRFEPIWL